jgi:tripartite ATP-independent transporter DctP family solute receptor
MVLTIPSFKKREDGMRTRSVLCGLVVVLVSLFMVAVFATASYAQEKQIKIRYVTQLPATHLLTQAEMKMAKAIEERSRGRVKVEVYPAGQLYKAMELLNAVMSGAAEMGTTPGAMFTGPVPAMDVFDIPLLLKDYGEVLKVWQGEPGDMLRAQMEKIGIKTIGFSAYGENLSFCSHKPLTKPADFKGLKIRCNTNMGADLVKEFGAAPVIFSSAEVYDALQRKTIDAANSGVTSFVERKWYEVTEHATLTWASYSVWPEMINLKFWNSLPKDIQQILLDVGKEHQAYLLKETARTDKEAVDFLKTKLKVYELTAADRKVWMDAGRKPVVDAWLKRTGSDGKKIMDWIDKNTKHLKE